MPRVRLPNGKIGVFPDDMEPAAIEAVLQKQFGTPADNAFWGGAQAADPRTSAGSTMTGEDVQRGAVTAAGLGTAYAIPAAIGAAVPAALAYPGTLAALGGGAAAAIEGAGPKGILLSALTGGAFTKLGKVWKVAKALGLVGKPAAGEAGALTQVEMQNIVKQMARAEPGAVMNPPVEEVAARMNPSTMPSLKEHIKISREALDAGEQVRANAARRLEELMGPENVPVGTPGELRTVARGMSKPPTGFVENPSPEMVAKFMEPAVPAGVDAEAVAALQKWGMSYDDAVRLASKATPAASPISTAVAPAASPSVPLAPATASVYAPLTEKPAAKQFEELLAQALKEGQAKAALKAAGRGERQLADSLGGVADEDALKLLAQGEGVTEP